MNGYMPRRDALALQYMRAFSDGISAYPSRFMLMPSDAVAIRKAVDEYAEALEAFHRLSELEVVAMCAALVSPELRRLLIKRGLEQVRAFSWDHSAHRLLQLFREVAAEPVRVAAPSKVAA